MRNCIAMESALIEVRRTIKMNFKVPIFIQLLQDSQTLKPRLLAVVLC